MVYTTNLVRIEKRFITLGGSLVRRIFWYRKCISMQAKIRIFRASVLPVLLYGSELWSLRVAEEQRLKTFYMRCLRTIIGVSIADRMKNDLVLQLTGQPPLENILRRNRLRWFGHVNRMNNDQNSPMLTKKTLFASFKDVKNLLMVSNYGGEIRS
jgi:hypothetical protein